ncbi:MAG: DNA polymerase III subunit gamma and tau, partial [Micropruina sp.]
MGQEELDPFDQDGPDLFGLGDPDELDVLEPLDEPETATSEATPEPIPAPQTQAQQPPAPVVERPEAPLALYRRYRPDTFGDLIGQDHVTEPLQRALVNNRVNHAYLFSGPRGCGKTTSARILARALNCERGPAPVPCGECRSCRDLARGGPGSIDVIEIDAASHGGVNEARDLRERAFFAPVHSRFKIYIIDEAHMVTKEGFNALLKVVEEPPPHVKFIFATTEPEKVLGTIRSRTHHYPFRLVPPKTLTAYLADLCRAEGIAVEPTVLPLVVRAGAGSVRDSLSVLDQLLGGAAETGVSYAQATGLLGFTPDALLDEIVDAFAAGDAQGVFAAIDRVIEVGQDPRRFGEDLLRRLRDLIIIAAVPDALSSGLVDVAGDQADRLSSQASLLGAGELTRAAEVLAVGLTEMRGTTAPRLHLELMCARVLLPGADVNDRGIHARLDRLERRLAIPSGHGRADDAGATSVDGDAPGGSRTSARGGEQPTGSPSTRGASADLAWPAVADIDVGTSGRAAAPSGVTAASGAPGVGRGDTARGRIGTNVGGSGSPGGTPSG